MGDTELAALKDAFAAASNGSEWSTIFVAFGVFIEFVALFVFSKEMPRVEKGVMVVATLLITLGCVGEFIYSSRATSAAQRLQNASDKQIADTVAMAAKLGVSFGNLDQYVKNKSIEFKTAADELNLKTKDLSVARSDAIKAAQETKNDLTEINGLLVREREIHNKIVALNTPRTLSKEQQKLISEKLKIFGKIPFDITLNDDHEAIDLTLQITSALEGAGWDWNPWSNFIEVRFFKGKPAMLAKSGLGIVIQVADSDLVTLQKPIEALADVLQESGLKNISKFQVSKEDVKFLKYKAGVIHIQIGAKQ
jgi:hypothetical protein